MTYTTQQALIILRAQDMRRTVGARKAAGYMRNSGAPIGVALTLLARPADQLPAKLHWTGAPC